MLVGSITHGNPKIQGLIPSIAATLKSLVSTCRSREWGSDPVIVKGLCANVLQSIKLIINNLPLLFFNSPEATSDQHYVQSTSMVMGKRNVRASLREPNLRILVVASFLRSAAPLIIFLA